MQGFQVHLAVFLRREQKVVALSVFQKQVLCVGARYITMHLGGLFDREQWLVVCGGVCDSLDSLIVVAYATYGSNRWAMKQLTQLING